jgi:hypothetical protein
VFCTGNQKRNATAPRAGQITLSEATAILAQLARHPGYRYLPIAAGWQTLCSPFFARLYGTRQVTDAYLLGLAVRRPGHHGQGDPAHGRGAASPARAMAGGKMMPCPRPSA